MADPAAARPAELFVDVEDAAFYDDHRDHLRDSAPPDPADAATDEAIRGEVNESYLSRARSSRVPFNHLTGLIAAAQLDDGSPPATRVGYPALFEATCERGGRHWLDPMPLLREINETLRRYLAPREALGPVVTLLTRLARCGISPYAVLDYVVAPRLREDRNWRRWGTAHLPVIAAVADLIERLRAAAPYDRPCLGIPRDASRGDHAVLTDVFLVKYVAAAFVGRRIDELTPATIEAIETAWRGLRLESRGIVLFLRSTVRPCVAKLGKRLEIRHYLEIVDALPEIERRIDEVESWRSGRRVFAAALYGEDPAAELARRERRGYKAIDFLREFRAAMRIYRTLLSRTGGAAAVERVIRRIRRNADPLLAGHMADLVERLQDTGGRHIYAWHAIRLARLAETDRDAFVRTVAASGGAHPDYPRYGALFRLDDFRYGRASLSQLAVALGLPEKRYESPRTLFREYITLHPDVEPLVDRFKRDVATGRDREWDAPARKTFDTLGGHVPDEGDPRVESLHSLLLYSTIRGLSGQYTRGVNSRSLGDLWSRFPTEAYPSAFDHRVVFDRGDLADRGVAGSMREEAAGDVAAEQVEGAPQDTPAAATAEDSGAPAEVPKSVKVSAIRAVWERIAAAAGDRDAEEERNAENPSSAAVGEFDGRSDGDGAGAGEIAEDDATADGATADAKAVAAAPGAGKSPPEVYEYEAVARSVPQAIGIQYRTVARAAESMRAQRGADHKATRRLTDQLSYLAAIQDAIPRFSEVGTICTGIVVAGYFGRKSPQLQTTALAAVMEWVTRDAGEEERLAFLREDIDAESITLRQLEYVVSFLTDTAESLAASPAVSEWVTAVTGRAGGAGATGAAAVPGGAEVGGAAGGAEGAATDPNAGADLAVPEDPVADALAAMALTKQKHLTSEAIDAAFRSIVNLSTLSKGLAKWHEATAPAGTAAQTAQSRQTTQAPHRQHPQYELFVSRSPLDAYFGDMGATCLSESPQHVMNPGFLTIRLADRRRDEIVGMAALQFVNNTVRSVDVTGFWFAFAFNPVRAVTTGLGETERLNLYLRFREVVAHVAAASDRRVFIPGIAVYGVVSNDTAFGDMIVAYERGRGGKFVGDATGFALQYPQSAYAQAILLSL